MISTCPIIAKGQLKLTVKETGKEILTKNMVIKNSPHITALSLGGDIVTTNIKVASWGDNFIEMPKASYFNMTTLESLENIHAIDANHTIKTIAVSGHSYPASKAVRFSFQFDRNTSPEFIGKNLLEFGLYFNDILFSRVALLEDNYFESWMTVVGEWTILFLACSGGYSNYLLNQYEITSLWTMDNVEEDYTVLDYAGRNNLNSVLPPAKLISNLVGINPNVTESDFIHRDSLCSFYSEGEISNILKIDEGEIYNNSLDLKNKFTMWQWFMTKNIDSAPFTLEKGGKWILFSKWVEDAVISQCSYRLYLERSPSSSTIDEVRLKFDINDGGEIVTISSDPLNYNPLATINLFKQWCLAVITLDPSTQKLTLYFNDVEVASATLPNNGETPHNLTTFFIGAEQQYAYQAQSVKANYVFKGFIDETGISPELFSRTCISLLWKNGFGDFYNP